MIYKNYTLISITDRQGNSHEDNWRDKYLNKVGTISFYYDYIGERMSFDSYTGGGLICCPDKRRADGNKLIVYTTNSIYTFEREKK